MIPKRIHVEEPGSREEQSKHVAKSHSHQNGISRCSHMSPAQYDDNQGICDDGSRQQKRSNIPIHRLGIVDGQFAGDVQKADVGPTELVPDSDVGLEGRVRVEVEIVGGIRRDESGQFGGDEVVEVDTFASVVVSRVSGVVMLEVNVPGHFVRFVIRS